MKKWSTKQDMDRMLDRKEFPVCLDCGQTYFHADGCSLMLCADNRSDMPPEKWERIKTELDRRWKVLNEKQPNGPECADPRCTTIAIGEMHVFYHNTSSTAEKWPVCMDHAFHEDSAGRECQFKGF